MSKRNYYDILGVKATATSSDIKKAYRTLSFKCHPDKNPGKEAQYKDINEAYEVLGDVDKRKEYDFMLKLSQSQNMPMNAGYAEMGDFGNLNMSMAMGGIPGFMFGEPSNAKLDDKIQKNIDFLLGSFIDGFVNGSSNANPSYKSSEKYENHKDEGYDLDRDHHNSSINLEKYSTNNIPTCIEPIIHELRIDFEQAYGGCCIPVTIERTVSLNNVEMKENERIYIDIPPGVDDDEMIEMVEKGHIVNNKKGNLKLRIKVNPHESLKFHRKGLDLIYSKEIEFKESLCGFDFVLEHLNGKQMKLSSSRGNIIQNNDRKIIKGLGFTRGDRTGTGDLIIEFKVKHPKEKLTNEQIAYIEEIF
jgi:DnaJ-class molecular chaperone